MAQLNNYKQSEKGAVGYANSIRVSPVELPALERNEPQVVVQGDSTRQLYQTEAQPTPWNWCSLVTSLISFLCCPSFGLVATAMATLSYIDHKTHEYAPSKVKMIVSYVFGITAIVLGVVCWAVLIYFFSIIRYS